MPQTLSKIAGIALIAMAAACVASSYAQAQAPPKAGEAEPATKKTIDRGAKIYATQCAECHGENGQGVKDAYEKPLGGDRTLGWLTRRIDRTMPEGEAKLCVGEDAAAVARYLYDRHYSPAARAKQAGAPRDALQHLTVEQHRQTLADLIASFQPQPPIAKQRGLWMQVYPGRGMKQKDKPVVEQVTPILDQSYTPEHPLYEKFDKLGHSVRWSGSLLADETGEYEIVVKSDQAMRLWLNNGKAQGGGISNEMADTKSIALLDGWLRSDEKTEWRKKVFLLAGRAYPLMLEFSAHNQGVGNKEWQKKHKGGITSYISLSWVPPGGAEQVIPRRHLSPKRAAEVFVMSAPFPPDDSSLGFTRGALVSQAWLDATTAAAVQATDYVIANLDALAGTHAKAKDRPQSIEQFCRQFVERAYRRPISDAVAKQAITRHFDSAPDQQAAVRRVVLSALISPQFLYPTLSNAKPDGYSRAANLALSMWDGLPDSTLRQAAAKGDLSTKAQIKAHAERMLKDPRAKAKLMRFFHHWLELERAEYVDKDDKLFPEFDSALLSDLRTSLDMFLKDAVFSDKSDYRELLLADYLYVNDRLAKVYGVDRGADKGKGFTRAKVPANKRSGLITHPYLLTAFAYHNSTSPIHRGVFLTRNIIGRPLNPPPNAIPFEDTEFDPSLTMREKVTAFTRASACMSCHATINPLGFSLEHYDSIGRWRAKDKDKPVNAESEFVDDQGKPMRLKGARDVAAFAVGSNAAQRGFVRMLYQHTTHREPAAVSAGLLDRLTRQFKADGFHIRNLFIQIALENAGAGIE